MTRDEMIDYINKVAKYSNVSAMCELYNNINDSKIDYNNLRVTIKRQSTTRMSDEKLSGFISFLKTVIVSDVFEVKRTNYAVEKKIIKIIDEKVNLFSEEIKEELRNELFN